MRPPSLRALTVVSTVGLAVVAASALGSRAHSTIAPSLSSSDVGPAPSGTLDTAVFAGGCFWGIEGVFEHIKGVKSATSGFAGGKTRSPSYEDVSSGETGHAESVQVVYDESQVSYPQLLRVFFSVHDPTQLDRQGPDEGTQYRSAVFYRNPQQRRVAEAYLEQLRASGRYKAPVVTELSALDVFYPAEGYHQHYMQLHPTAPYIVINDAPKVALLKRAFPQLYREAWQ